MALRDLETTQMVDVSRRWTQSPMKEVIVSLPVVGAYYPVLEGAHKGLTLKQRKPDPNQQLADIKDKQTPIDVRHDNLLRGSYLMLSGLAALAQIEEERAMYLQLRKTFHPFAMAGTQKTYREEAGAAELIERDLTDTTKKQLAQVPLPSTMTETPTLLEVVTERIEKGKELGKLEDERDEASKPAAQEGDISANEARLQWIDVVTTFERLLKSARTPEKEVEALLQPLRDAEAVAEKRKTSNTPIETPAEDLTE